jgi:hypothetical protein
MTTLNRLEALDQAIRIGRRGESPSRRTSFAFCSAPLTQDNAAIVGGERLRASRSSSRDHAWIIRLGGCHPGVVLLAW